MARLADMKKTVRVLVALLMLATLFLVPLVGASAEAAPLAEGEADELSASGVVPAEGSRAMAAEEGHAPVFSYGAIVAIAAVSAVLLGGVFWFSIKKRALVAMLRGDK